MAYEKHIETGNESVLACRAISGDRKALEALLHKNWQWMRTVTSGYVRRFHDIDDILQNVCLRVMLKIHTLREPERFKPWLATIARREAMEFAKKPHISLADDAGAGPVADGADVDAQRREEQQLVSAAVMELPEKYRQSLLLKYYHHYSYDEIAEILDITSAAVQSRLFRARKMMAAILEKKPIHKIPRG